MSPDGRWLAYVASKSSKDSTAELWLAHGDGTDAHVVPGLSVADLVGWSPTADVLAIGANSMVTVSFPDGSKSTTSVTDKLDLLSPPGHIRSLVALPGDVRRPLQMSNARWAPDGRAVGIATWAVGDDGPAAVSSYPISGAAPTTWFSISATAQLPGTCDGCGGGMVVPTIAGWWKRWGIGFWVASSGATRNLDSTPLELVTSPGATPRVIGETLSDGATIEGASDSHGDLALVGSTRRSGREYGSGKAVEVCHRSTESCTALPGAAIWHGKPLPCPAKLCSDILGAPSPGSPGSGVTVDPAWSPSGRLLAFEKAPAVPIDVGPVDQWYNAHELFVWSARTGKAHEVPALNGAAVPTWSPSGSDLLYVDDDALWLWPTAGGRPRRIVAPLFPENEWKAARGGNAFSFYNQVDWLDQFSWWSK